MKKVFVVLVSVLISGSVFANFEESNSHFGLGGYYGFTSPSDLGDGDVYGLNMDYDVNPNFRARIGFNYMSGFDVKDYDQESFLGFVGQSFDIDDIDITGIEMGGIIMFNPIEDVLTLYCGVGFSAYYIPDIHIYGRHYREDVTIQFDPAFGFWGCVGAELGYKNFKVFVEVKGTWADNHDLEISVEDWYYGYYGDVKIDLTNVQTVAGAKLVF